MLWHGECERPSIQSAYGRRGALDVVDSEQERPLAAVPGGLQAAAPASYDVAASYTYPQLARDARRGICGSGTPTQSMGRKSCLHVLPRQLGEHIGNRRWGDWPVERDHDGEHDLADRVHPVAGVVGHVKTRLRSAHGR